uniref:Uncharacterized protein n=1 Tax=Anguilla anguilla TaxID=7936 RepID=A0A0E9WKW8_ANGAN
MNVFITQLCCSFLPCFSPSVIDITSPFFKLCFLLHCNL